MKQKQFVAYGLITSVVLGVIAYVLSYDALLSDGLFTLAGLGFYVFGIWGAVCLLK